MFPFQGSIKICIRLSRKFLGHKKDSGLATLLLQFDFSKASHQISPSRLLAKLKGLCSCKIALSWFCSYLFERSQCVFSRSLTFEYRNINLGVPQGSILGPFYFVSTLMTSKDTWIIANWESSTLMTYYVQVLAHAIEQRINLLSEAAKKVTACAALNYLTQWDENQRTSFQIITYHQTVQKPEHGNQQLRRAGTLSALWFCQYTLL